MAKSQARRRAAEVDDENEDQGGEIIGAKPKSSTKMVSVRVKPGQTVIVGETNDDGEAVERVYRAGQTCSLSEDEVKARPWAFESGERRARSGQTTRLQKKVAELEAEIKRLKDAGKDAGKPDPNRDAAIESIMARGDNYGGRGEPSLGSVPPDVVEQFESGRDAAFVASGPSLDEETGYKGRGAETGGTGDNRMPAVTTPGAAPSIPSNPGEGESVRPGTGEPSGGE